MKYDKRETANLIKQRLSGESYLTYKEIAAITGYHPKYILKLKKEIEENTISYIHGNKGIEPINKMSEAEEQNIVALYKRSNCSIRKFCRFYGNRSYSCIYNILKKNELIK